LVDDFLLEVLACPRCDSRPPLRIEGEFLVCTECGWGYRIIDEIPQMLAEDAVPPEEMKKENA
jgi:uncharacterized protein YbaR (Trm112 family)